MRYNIFAPAKSNENSYVCILCKRKFILGEPVSYYLYRKKKTEYNGFVICITGYDETIRRIFSSDTANAVFLFEMITSGDVTPCTFNDVIDDYFYLPVSGERTAIP